MKIKIERFKSLSSVEFDLDKINLIIGGNNAGKSSALQAIQFGIGVAQTTNLQNSYWNEGRLSTSIGQNELIYSPLKDVTSLAPNGKLRESVDEAIQITYKEESNECRVTVKKGRNKNIQLELVGEILGKGLQSLNEPFSALVPGLAGIPNDEKFETNYVVKKSAARGDSNRVFRNILWLLKQSSDKWSQFIEYLNRIFPEHQINVRFNHDTDEVIDCVMEKNGISLPIDACGTGVLQAIHIFSYTCLFNPKILILDEPDSHLHPNNQKALASEIIRLADSGTKIIISSHSRHFVEAIIDYANIVWLKNGGMMSDVDNYEVQALIEIGALNAGERIGNATYVILTEDSHKQNIELMLEANNFDMAECEILAYKGCTNEATALTFINHLRKTNVTAKYILHRDRDFLDKSSLSEIKEKLNKQRVELFLPIGNDIESYFVAPEHIAYVCNISLEEARAIIDSAFELRCSRLNEKYVNTRINNERKKGNQVNAGAISAEWGAKRDSEREEIVHGKELLHGIREILRQKNISDNIFSLSPSLQIDFLQNVKKK